MAAGAMKVVFPNRFVRYDLIRCIALASFVHTPSGLSTTVWPETYHFETEPLLWESAMSRFYVLPPRPDLGERFASFLRLLFPGLDWDAAMRLIPKH